MRKRFKAFRFQQRTFLLLLYFYFPLLFFSFLTRFSKTLQSIYWQIQVFFMTQKTKKLLIIFSVVTFGPEVLRFPPFACLFFFSKSIKHKTDKFSVMVDSLIPQFCLHIQTPTVTSDRHCKVPQKQGFLDKVPFLNFKYLYNFSIKTL